MPQATTPSPAPACYRIGGPPGIYIELGSATLSAYAKRIADFSAASTSGHRRSTPRRKIKGRAR